MNKTIRTIVILTIIIFSHKVTLAYNRSQVARYADKWVSETQTKRNPFFKNYSADCANYVSQCLIAGGIDLSTDPNCDERHAIPNVDHLNDNLRRSQSATVTTIVYPTGSPPSNLTTGDVIIFGDEVGDHYQHVAIVVGGTGNNCICNAHSNDRYHKKWNWAWGTGTGQWKRATFYHIPDNAGTKPDLKPYLPSNWECPLVPSSVTGTHTVGPNLVAGQPIYIDWAMENSGGVDIPDVITYTLYIDNSPVQSWISDGLWYTIHYDCVEDYSYTITTSGYHTLEIKADPNNYWAESDESNNSYSGTWFWGAGVEEITNDEMNKSFLFPCNPNPFTSITKINYQISKDEKVTICILDNVGRIVKTLVDGRVKKGHYSISWNGRDKVGERVPSGIYFCKMESESYKNIRKIILINNFRRR